MDSQDNILEQEVKQEVIQDAEVPEVTNEEEAQPRKVYETKAEVLRRVQDIAHGEEAPQKDVHIIACRRRITCVKIQNRQIVT